MALDWQHMTTMRWMDWNDRVGQEMPIEYLTRFKGVCERVLVMSVRFV